MHLGYVGGKKEPSPLSNIKMLYYVPFADDNTGLVDKPYEFQVNRTYLYQ